MRSVVAAFASLAAVGCLGLRPGTARPEYPAQVSSLTLVGQFSLPPLTRFPETLGLPLGGVSGLAMRPGSHELLGISDAQQGGRIYRFTIEGLDGDLRVTPFAFIPLEAAPENYRPDHESLTTLPNGNFLVSSEGSVREPRLPPAIAEYGPYGDFVRLLPIRDRYVPEANGSLTKGARGNAGFESLTLSPDGRRLFAGTETALLQDGDPATFDAGTRARILEYVPRGGSFAPAREFVYPVEKIDKPPFEHAIALNGLVDLLALDRSTLLALERGYVEERGKTGRNVNQIRLYRISLAGATDVSSLESLKGNDALVPVTKTLLLDLATVAGLDAYLARGLDNFEGMTFGPRLADGRATLLLVSDDNFNAAQRTWFLRFAIQ